MPVMVTLTWADITPEQYDAVRQSAAVGSDEPLVHVAAFDGTTLHVTEVWDDEGAARSHADALAAAGDAAGVASRPAVVVLPAHAVVLPAHGSAGEARPRRVLLVANRTLGTPQVDEALQERLGEGGDCEVHVLVPIAPPRPLAPAEDEDFDDPVLGRASQAGTSDEQARHRLYAELDRLHSRGTAATGEVGGADPLESVRALLAKQRFDEVILSTLAPGASRWLKMDLPSRLQRMAHVPVSVVIAPTPGD